MFFDLITGTFENNTENPTIHVSDTRLRFWDSHSSFNITFNKGVRTNLNELSYLVNLWLKEKREQGYSERGSFIVEYDTERMNLCVKREDIYFAISFPAKNFSTFVNSFYFLNCS